MPPRKKRDMSVAEGEEEPELEELEDGEDGRGVDMADISETDKAQFKKMVLEWAALPEQIKLASEPVKQLKARHAETETLILDFMSKNQLTHCGLPEECGGGNLVIGKSTVKEALKKDNWERGINNLAKKRKIKLTYAEVEQFVNETRGMKEKQKLKRRKK